MSTHTLIVLRHAKAEQPGDVADINRPLSPRGRRDAVAVGSWLAEHKLLPNLVLCSPALRTRETWQGVRASIGEGHGTFRSEPTIYHGGVADLLELLHAVDESVATVAIVGHNPAMSRLVFALDPAAVFADSYGLRTAECSVHTADQSWRGLEIGSVRQIRSHVGRS